MAGCPADSDAFASAGGVAALVAAISTQLADASAVQTGFTILSGLSGLSGLSSAGLSSPLHDAIIAAGGLQLCEKALRAHSAHAGTAGCIMILPAALSMASRAAAAFFARNMLDLLKDAQRMHVSDLLVQVFVWAVYEAAAAHGLITSLDRVGGSPAVDDALRRHGGVCRFVTSVVRVLNTVEADAVACSACIPALVAAWRRNAADEGVVSAVASVLARIGTELSNVQAMATAGCLDLAVAGLGLHVKADETARNLCTVLGTLLAALRQRDAFIGSGAVSAMLTALQRHPLLEGLPEAVCASVSMLVMGDADSCLGRAIDEVRPLPGFFELPAHVRVVLPAVASGIIPAMAAWLPCVREIAAVGRCACRPLGLLICIRESFHSAAI